LEGAFPYKIDIVGVKLVTTSSMEMRLRLAIHLNSCCQSIHTSKLCSPCTTLGGSRWSADQADTRVLAC